MKFCLTSAFILTLLTQWTSLALLSFFSLQNAALEHKGTAALLLEKGSEKSPIKARQPRKVDLRARYWAFLFDNLRRAVDEIYVTCESDQSVVECRVSVLLTGSHSSAFSFLREGLNRGYSPTLEGDVEIPHHSSRPFSPSPLTKIHQHGSHSSCFLLYVTGPL